MAKVTDPSAMIIPFGKHKGATVAEVLGKDPQYADWIANQGWVAERFAELHAAILARGAGSDDSPEHNAIQVRFLDETFRLSFALAAYPERLSEYATHVMVNRLHNLSKKLDHAEGRAKDSQVALDGGYPGSWAGNEGKWIDRNLREIDIQNELASGLRAEIEAEKALPIDYSSRAMFEQRGVDVVIDGFSVTYGDFLLIEIKPSVGDDFPSIMRQMQNLKAKVLVIGEYNGRAVSVPQLRQMFEANRMVVVFVRDIEAEIPKAREMLASTSPLLP